MMQRSCPVPSAPYPDWKCEKYYPVAEFPLFQTTDMWANRTDERRSDIGRGISSSKTKIKLERQSMQCQEINSKITG
jgi:hypothetical protein